MRDELSDRQAAVRRYQVDESIISICQDLQLAVTLVKTDTISLRKLRMRTDAHIGLRLGPRPSPSYSRARCTKCPRALYCHEMA